MNRRRVWDPVLKQVVDADEYENRAEPAIPFANGLASDAAAVHPSQIKEFQNSLHLRDLGVEYKGDGRPVFRSRGQRAEYLKRRGLHDKSGGYRETH